MIITFFPIGLVLSAVALIMFDFGKNLCKEIGFDISVGKDFIRVWVVSTMGDSSSCSRQSKLENE